MSLDLIRRECERSLPAMQRALHLHDWRITVQYGPCPSPHDGATAICKADPTYEHALITIDPDQLDGTREDALRILRHELLHVVLSEVSPVDQTASAVLQPLGLAAVTAYEELSGYAVERQVRAVEKLLDLGLGIDAEEMVARELADQEDSES